MELEALKSMKGKLSSSLMMKVWTLSDPRIALIGFDKVTMTVSFSSSSMSSTILVIVIVAVVSPALIASVPSAKV